MSPEVSHSGGAIEAQNPLLMKLMELFKEGQLSYAEYRELCQCAIK